MEEQVDPACNRGPVALPGALNGGTVDGWIPSHPQTGETQTGRHGPSMPLNPPRLADSRQATGKSDPESILKKGASIIKTTECTNVRITPSEPGEGDEAPQPSAETVSDLEEATDDVEFPEAVVLVGKTHWRCVSCMAYFSRTSSIDEHLYIYHSQQAPPPNTLKVTAARRGGRGRGRRPAHGKIPAQAAVQQKSHRSSRQEAGDEQSLGDYGREMAIRGRPKPLRGRGRGFRGSKGIRGGRGRGGRGKGRVFTKPLTSEDSDTEVDSPAVSTPLKTSLKRKMRNSSNTDKQEPVIDTAFEVSRKKPRDVEEDLLAPGETAVESAPLSQETAKELMKEKYVVIVGKVLDCSTELESHMDIDPPLPIEIPSLQADALLPPSTPIMPDIQGPPETPLSHDSIQLPETPQQPEAASVVDTQALGAQEPSNSHEFLLPGTPAILSALAYETNIVKMESSEIHQVTAGDFSTGFLVQNKPADTVLEPMVCKTCGVVFDSIEELTSHRQEMANFDVVSCNNCRDKFHGLHQLNIHVFNTHEKFAPKFCFFCDADCLDEFELEEHLLGHTSNDIHHLDNIDTTIKHTCKTCGTEVEGNLPVLTNHYHSAHKQFICTECNELFDSFVKFEEHRALHTSDTFNQNDPVVYSCPVSDCFQICSNKEALMDHISWHEDRDLEEEQLCTVYCCHCNEPFRNNIALERHLAETHSEADLKPFVCELCKKKFGHSQELHHHNTLHHAGIKRYGCAYCDQRFAFRSAHRQHVASEHDVAATVLRM